MIQRIQSLYLALIAFFAVLFLKGGFLNFADRAGEVIKVTLTGVLHQSTGNGLELIEKLIPLSLLIILIPIISLITIFFYKNRKVQLRLSLILLILAAIFVIALIHVSLSIVSKFNATIVPGYKLILPVLILLFSVLAYGGIKKDDRLVKSYDRLR